MIHSEFCEADGKCPTTGEQSCGKIVVWHPDQTFTIYCFGCKKTHHISFENPPVIQGINQ